MDAATLYAIMSVASGPKRMTTQKYPTMNICEQVAQKLRKKSSMKDAIFYCVKRKADASERAAVQAATAAAKRRQMPPSASAAAQQKAAGPIGMPRDFYSGTTAPLQ